MLSRAVRGALHHPRLVAAACVVFLIYGALLVRSEKLDILPPLSPASASVETEAPGMVAEQVEALVTRPVENAVLGARGVAAVHSQSIQGLSLVTLEFQAGADPDRVRQAISEGLVQAAGGLPRGVGAPRLSPLTAGGAELLRIGFTSAKLTPMSLRDVVQWTVRPRLLSTAGVASVQVFGGETRRIEVRARAGDLSDSDLGYADVFNAVQRATGVAGAGFIDTPTQRVQIEPHGQALTATDVAAGQIQVVGSAPVRISDVADVVDAPAPAFGDALIDGRPGVIANIAARFDANTLDATHAVETTLGGLKPALESQGVTLHADLDMPAGFITSEIREILWELAVSAVLLALLLVLFLRDWRAAIVSVISIPLSIVATLVVLKLLGWTLNTMTLGGVAVAMGLIVDDAVIDVESILSELRSAEARHASRPHAILLASLSVRGPVIFITLMVAAALLPIVFLGGVQGALLRPLAVSLIVATLSSLVVAILVTPALALLILKHIKPEIEPPIVHRLKTSYNSILVQIDRRPRPILILALAMGVIAAAALATMKTDLAPGFHTDELTVEINAPASTSLAVMRDYGQRITRDLMADPNVARVSQTIGRAETGDKAWGPEHAAFGVALKPGLSASGQNAVERKVRAIVEAYPGLHAEVRSTLGETTSVGGDGHGIEARINGDDLAALDLTAKRVADTLRSTKGVRAVTTTAADTAPVVRVDLNFQRLAIYGLSAADVLNTVQTAFAGRNAAEIYENGRAVDIAVTAQADIRQDPEGVGKLLLRSSSGVSVPLKSVANIYLTDGRSRIDHDGGLRSERVLADPPNGGQGALQALESQVVKAVTPAPGAFVEFSGPDLRFDPNHSLAVNAGLAGAGVLALLLLAFGNARSSGIVLGSTLFAFIGGVIAVFLMGGVLSLGALMGFFALFGLSARNAALLVTRVDELVTVQKADWTLETVRRAAHDRFSPMAISAAAVFVGVLPFALRADTPGHEVLGPMVFVIIGGLVTSTLMGMLLLPAVVFQVWRPSRAPQRITADPAS